MNRVLARMSELDEVVVEKLQRRNVKTAKVPNPHSDSIVCLVLTSHHTVGPLLQTRKASLMHLTLPTSN